MLNSFFDNSKELSYKNLKGHEIAIYDLPKQYIRTNHKELIESKKNIA